MAHKSLRSHAAFHQVDLERRDSDRRCCLVTEYLWTVSFPVPDARWIVNRKRQSEWKTEGTQLPVRPQVSQCRDRGQHLDVAKRAQPQKGAARRRRYSRRKQGVNHAWNSIDRGFSLSAVWGDAQMVAQPKLGLCADRRRRNYLVNRGYPAASRQNLIMCALPLLKMTWTPSWRRVSFRALVIAFAVLICSGGSSAYSVLTHEEIVDLAWASEIRPLLLQRYPGLSEDQITEAHAYAYGGAVIQDLGYYPFGNKDFSNLVHYVRSGDFVRELLLESQDADEYAFALGALSHYTSDIAGHPAVNQSVAIEYPKLRAKFGKSVRYAEDKTAHLKTEFGFDTLQVAKNRYASQQYHDFIGFQLSKPLLERVFPVVYGVELKDVLTHEDLAVGSYRFAISRLIPQMTQVALQTHKKEIMRETPNFARRKFLYRLSRSGYEKEWGKDYVKPGMGTRVLSTLLRYVPRVGPFKGLSFNSPSAQTEDLYIKSINTTVDQYRAFLDEVRMNTLVLPNRDLDSGQTTKAAEYSLTDDSYAKLLARLSERKFDRTSPELRENILQFYSDLSLPIETKIDQVRWRAVLTELNQLKVATPAAGPSEVLPLLRFSARERVPNDF